MTKQFDQKTIVTMRAVLKEAAQQLNPSQATKAKMAESILRKAAQGNASREELKDSAVKAGQRPAA